MLVYFSSLFGWSDGRISIRLHGNSVVTFLSKGEWGGVMQRKVRASDLSDKSINLIEISMNEGEVWVKHVESAGFRWGGKKHQKTREEGGRKTWVAGACFISMNHRRALFARRTHNITLMLFTLCRKNPLFTLTSSRWWRRWWEGEEEGEWSGGSGNWILHVYGFPVRISWKRWGCFAWTGSIYHHLGGRQLIITRTLIASTIYEHLKND